MFIPVLTPSLPEVEEDSYPLTHRAKEGIQGLNAEYPATLNKAILLNQWLRGYVSNVSE